MKMNISEIDVKIAKKPGDTSLITAYPDPIFSEENL